MIGSWSERMTSHTGTETRPRLLREAAVGNIGQWAKELYNPKAFITHAALLDQACAHCPIFPTAASRRSLGLVSVPVWLIILSDQLRIIALVGRYPTNQLIRRGPLLLRINLSPGFPRGACGISRSFP